MSLGERLLQYRKSINMSQDQLAEKIGVTRQTISKWETDQSTPEFNKIEPLCKVFGITTDELIKGESIINKEDKEKQKENNYDEKRNKKKAIVLSISIFLYCIATFSLPYMTEVLRYEDAHAVMIWATLCTIATVIIIYFFVAYPKNKNEKSENIIGEEIEELNNTIEEINQIDDGNVKAKVIGSNTLKEITGLNICRCRTIENEDLNGLKHIKPVIQCRCKRCGYIIERTSNCKFTRHPDLYTHRHCGGHFERISD